MLMYSAAPRIERRFLKRVAKLDDRSKPIAETYRRTRDLATQMGVPRPSYERVRLHLHAARRREDERRRTRDLILQLAYNTRPANEVVPELLRLVD
jgi:hypothetical protein